jgi:RNA polymerase sigma factor (sigma-70 family)
MAYITGERRDQATLFPIVLDDLVPNDHMCRVIDAFVSQLDMENLGFERAQPAGTGRPGYDPRSLLKLYIYGYLNQIRSSRRLEAECRRNVEVMWLLESLYPDYKSIAEFRRMHREAVTAAGAELVGFAKNCGLIRGEWIAVDRSKFRAVASIDTARERFQLQRYLDSMEQVDSEHHPEINMSEVQTALERLKRHSEPEVGFMVMGRHTQPAYNMQSVVDAEHALIIAHDVVLDAADNRSLEPMAAAAKAVLGDKTFNVVADAGYSNGEQASNCEARGIMPCVPATRTRNPHGDGTFFQCDDFRYQPETDTYLCPGNKTLKRKAARKKDNSIIYVASPNDCSACPLKKCCTSAPRRMMSRHMYEDALKRMNERATPAIMRLRRSIVEHPSATIKYRIFGHPRLLLRGRAGARTEIGLAVMVYNLKRMATVLGPAQLTQAFRKIERVGYLAPQRTSQRERWPFAAASFVTPSFRLSAVCFIASGAPDVEKIYKTDGPRALLPSHYCDLTNKLFCTGVEKSRGRLWFIRTGKSLDHDLNTKVTFVYLDLSILRFAMGGAGGDLPLSGEMSLFANADHRGSKMRKSIVDLYDSLRPGLFAYLVSLGLNRNQAEDVVHDSFLKLIQHLLNKEDQQDLRGWIFRVAHNLAINLHLSAYHRLSDSIGGDESLLAKFADSSLSPEELVIKKEELSRVQAAMSRLTQQQRYAVLLRAEGLRYREIAQTLGISIARVAELVQRALARLAGDL